MGITTRVTLSGRFFEARDPGLTVQQNIHAMVQDIADDAAKDIVGEMVRGQSGREPIRAISDEARAADFVHGRVASLSGKPWHYTAVVSPDPRGLTTSQAIALYAAASQIERRNHPFRNATRNQRRALRDLSAGLE